MRLESAGAERLIMPKFKEAMDRIFKNVFVCRVCKSKIRADPLKVRLGLVKCRKCKSKKLRVKHKEVKGAGGAGAAPGAAPAGGKGAAPAGKAPAGKPTGKK